MHTLVHLIKIYHHTHTHTHTHTHSLSPTPLSLLSKFLSRGGGKENEGMDRGERYKMNRLPFGVVSAPSLFQRIMENILHGLAGVSISMTFW